MKSVNGNMSRVFSLLIHLRWFSNCPLSVRHETAELSRPNEPRLVCRHRRAEVVLHACGRVELGHFSSGDIGCYVLNIIASAILCESLFEFLRRVLPLRSSAFGASVV